MHRPSSIVPILSPLGSFSGFVMTRLNIFALMCFGFSTRRHRCVCAFPCHHIHPTSFYVFPRILEFSTPSVKSGVVCLIRNAFILAISECQIHVLQTLRRRTLEQIVDSSVDDNSLSRAVYGKAADFNTVLARNRLHERRLAGDFDEFFSGVSVLVDVADVAGGHGAVEGDGDGVLYEINTYKFTRLDSTYVDTLEPDGDVWNECDLFA